MTAPTTNLATRLLAFAPSTEVVDALLPHAVIDDNVVPLGQAPSAALGTQQARRGVKYAASVATAPGVDPALLARLAKLPQKTVRRLVAGNPNTPAESLQTLAAWALKENDEETLDALCATIPPPQWLPTMTSLRDVNDYSTQTGYRASRGPVKLNRRPFVDQLIRRGDPDLVWDTYRCGVVPVCRDIVAAAARGHLPVPAHDLIEAAAPHLRPALLDAVLTDTTIVLNEAVTGHVVAWATNPDADIPPAYRKRLCAGRNLPPHAVAAFLDSGDTCLLECVARSAGTGRADVDETQLEALVDSGDETVADVLLSSTDLRDRLTGDQVAAAAINAAPKATQVRQILQSYGAQLPSEAIVNLLRNGDHRITESWLTGQLPCTPTLYELRALAEDAGSAVPPTKKPESVADLVDAFSDAFKAETAAVRGVDVVLNAAGQVTLTRALIGDNRWDGTTQPNGFAAYLAQRITTAFGADPDAWVTAVAMADKVTVDTVDDFITVVAGMVVGTDLGATA